MAILQSNLIYSSKLTDAKSLNPFISSSSSRHHKIRKAISLNSETNSDINHYISLLNSDNLLDFRQIHAVALKSKALKSKKWLWNKLAVLYARNSESLDSARKLFDEIRERTIPAYAALIGSYCRSEKWEEVFSVMSLMIDDGLMPDKFLVPTILKACSGLKTLRTGKMIHGFSLRKGFESDVFTGNALIDMYSNCSDLKYAENVFDAMNERDVVSWTALVSAYMENGLLDEAVEAFGSMRSNGLKPDLISWNALAYGFARNSEISRALGLLSEMRSEGVNPRVNSWNGIISGCVHAGHFADALDVFTMMLGFLENPNLVTITTVVSACAELIDSPKLGRSIHTFALRRELIRNVRVEGSLINMYGKHRKIEYAERIFARAVWRDTAMWNEMILACANEGWMREASNALKLMQDDGFKPDAITFNTLLGARARRGHVSEAYKVISEMYLVGLTPSLLSFNALISGFQQSGFNAEALKVFRMMQSPLFPKASSRPDTTSISSALAACSDLKSFRQGKEIHCYVLRNGFESNDYVLSSLVDTYMKCSDVGLAEKSFRMVHRRNTICWNVLISGYVRNGRLRSALEVFKEMVAEGHEANEATLRMLVGACGETEDLSFGRQFHGSFVKNVCEEGDESSMNDLIEDMYGKCERLKQANNCLSYFKSVSVR